MLRKAAGILLLVLSGILLAVALRRFPHDPRRALALAGPAAVAAGLNLALLANRPWRPTLLPRASAGLICVVAAGALILQSFRIQNSILPGVPPTDVVLREQLNTSSEGLASVAAAMLCAGASVA